MQIQFTDPWYQNWKFADLMFEGKNINVHRASSVPNICDIMYPKGLIIIAMVWITRLVCKDIRSMYLGVVALIGYAPRTWILHPSWWVIAPNSVSIQRAPNDSHFAPLQGCHLSDQSLSTASSYYRRRKGSIFSYKEACSTCISGVLRH